MSGTSVVKTFLLVLFLVITIGTTESQTTVYNNFGPDHDGWDYTYTTGWTVAGEDVEQQYGVEQAMSFESTEEGYVTDIWVGFFYVPSSNDPDTVTIRLVPNPTGAPPDTNDILEEWILTEFTSWSQWDPPIHLEGNGTTFLEAGYSYWLWAVAHDETWAGWCLNSDPALTCPHAMRREGEDWLAVSDETASAFRVDVTEEINTVDEVNKPSDFVDLSAYPNPFNPTTNLYYNLDKSYHVNLTIYDALGRKSDVIENGIKPAGNYKSIFRGNDFPAGIYFAVLKTGEQFTSKKIVLVK